MEKICYYKFNIIIHNEKRELMKNIEVKKHNNLEYVIKYPCGFDSNKKYPLIIFLHGAGSRGKDINLIIDKPIINKLIADNDTNFIVAAPQCFADTWFEIFEQLIDFSGAMIILEFLDKSRVYLTGNSMGGYTTWQLAMTKPEWFAAIAPICGGGMYWNACRLKDVPVWAFHGLLDDVVFIEESIKMVNGVNKSGGSAKLTIYEKAMHDSWTKTYANDELYKWFLSNVKQ